MKRTTQLLLIACMTWFCACSESERFEIEKDKTPPSKPTFVSSKPLNGGARIFYRLPAEDDVLGIEASFMANEGKTYSSLASYYIDSVDIVGLGTQGEHDIWLRTVDRSGNKSEAVSAKVISDVSSGELVAQSLIIKPSFSSLIVHWQNPLKKRETVYVSVNFTYTVDGQTKQHSVVNTSQAADEKYVIALDSLYISPETALNVTTQALDKYGNLFEGKDTTLNLLNDRVIPKDNWKLLPVGAEMGGIKQSNGSEADGLMYKVIDGQNDALGLKNYYYCSRVPWNIIIDMGAEYELSRILTHQRYTFDGSIRGAYYRGNNVGLFSVYVWDEATAAWTPVLIRHTLEMPNAKTEEDFQRAGHNGDMAVLYPEDPGYTPKSRYLRFAGERGNSLSEITLYGK